MYWGQIGGSTIRRANLDGTGQEILFTGLPGPNFIALDLNAIPEPPDYNGNGLVDQGDLDLVLLNWGADATTPPDGWTNSLPTGAIDQEELDAILLHWGEGAAIVSASNAGPVPEPSTFVLLGSAAMILLVRRAQQRHRALTSDPFTC
jgi:hypothetical protein